jgi:hypothetical protein
MNRMDLVQEALRRLLQLQEWVAPVLDQQQEEEEQAVQVLGFAEVQLPQRLEVLLT